MIEWVIGAAALAACSYVVVKFWNVIKDWLNNSAADAVEKVLGYGARSRMHKAVATIDKHMNKIRNITIVYTKKGELDAHFHKTTLMAECETYAIDEGVLREIEKKEVLVQEFDYRG